MRLLAYMRQTLLVKLVMPTVLGSSIKPTELWKRIVRTSAQEHRPWAGSEWDRGLACCLSCLQLRRMPHGLLHAGDGRPGGDKAHTTANSPLSGHSGSHRCRARRGEEGVSTSWHAHVSTLVLSVCSTLIFSEFVLLHRCIVLASPTQSQFSNLNPQYLCSLDKSNDNELWV